MTPTKNDRSASSVRRPAYGSRIPVVRTAVRSTFSSLVLTVFCAVSYPSVAFETGRMENPSRYLDSYAEAMVFTREFITNIGPEPNCSVQFMTNHSPYTNTPYFGVPDAVYERQGYWAWVNAQGYICGNKYAYVGKITWTCPAGTFGSTEGDFPGTASGAGYGCYPYAPTCDLGETYNPSTGKCDAPLKNHGPPPCD